MNQSIKIKSQRPLISVQDVISFIEKGEKYIKIGPGNITDDDLLDVLQGIVLSPDYQRQYRSTPQEESSIIESLLLEIPIPEIFLVRASKEGVQVRHVMDGQHRLTAIYRYVKDEFALKGLTLLNFDERYVNRKFSELDKKDKIKILGSHLSILEFDPFEDDEIEIELFKRYNRNTKPLEAQEIAMATYFSNTSQFISNYINVISANKEKSKCYYELSNVYNITKHRKEKQKNHQEICIILSILEYGPDLTAKDGVKISTNFLREKSQLFKVNQDENLIETKENLNSFNQMILKLANEIEYPFSTSVFKDSDKRMVKFHVGVSIVLSLIKYFYEVNVEHSNFIIEVKEFLNLSPLGDAEYNASSTNMKSILNYLFIKNRVDRKEFDSLIFKSNKGQEIQELLKRIGN
ncbi:DUF262 domain-containing protein [Planococcus faecalis]|uniref:GmrSD restriction endonucleases N-terminal domain-containing protein n=1 Tax=Planococcus faecalis TaxID=1598147 RepID=A0ABM6IPB1_9BACL|nr:DUF262 domain-containing protein [Planococcus faecalis]AQU78423.1 hypothetical protein AJGP001_03530 [Planococcus faecalis]OHX52384.1 hypothetical protein BB777_12085 [Planococcus faecalis]